MRDCFTRSKGYLSQERTKKIKNLCALNIAANASLKQNIALQEKGMGAILQMHFNM